MTERNLWGALCSPIGHQIDKALMAVKTVCPEAVVVGGCLRDLLHDRPIKDIDIFVQQREGLFERLCGHFGSLSVGIAMPEAVASYSKFRDGDGIAALYEVAMAGVDYPLNLIAVDGEVTAQRVRDRVDFAFCQVSWDGELLKVGSRFHEGGHYIGPDDPVQIERSRRRAARLSQKYPEMTFVFPEAPLSDAMHFDPEEFRL